MATLQLNDSPFDELNDEIGADDWLIPGKELTKRRLIKQTPRYNIFKADWFGDVLVYEPTEQATHRRQQGLATRRKTTQQHQQLVHSINQHELDNKFNELVLKLRSSHFNQSQASDTITNVDSCLPSPTFSCNSDRIDSGYSSPSSTPQYSTKNISEFEFPTSSSVLAPSSSLLTTSSSSSSSVSRSENSNDLDFTETTIIKARKPIETSCEEESERNLLQDRMFAAQEKRPVVLNKDSFEFALSGCDEQLNVDESKNETDNYIESNNMGRWNGDIYQNSDYHYYSNQQETGANNGTEVAWFELNELRLVAHEGFMLFMGASMDLSEVRGDQNASLVMQMSHPKAVSLFNLLHANNYAPSSPVDRFFASSVNKQNRQQLDLAAKFDICQQVTNAMTYLHDKNIVHGRLTSVNIYIELNKRVKISLIDNDEQPIAATANATGNVAALSYTKGIINQSPASSATTTTTTATTTTTTTTSTTTTTGNANTNRHPNAGSISFSLPALTYLSPEIIKTIRIWPRTITRDNNNCDNNRTEARVQMDTSQLTKKADIFSFGTLVYELFEERFPYAKAMDQTNDHQSLGNNKYDPFLGYLSQSLLTTNTPSPMKSPLVKNMHETNWNGNIQLSASELIFQIGSGHMDAMNKSRDKCPALVDYIISSCWSREPNMRPNFKQLAFAFMH